MAPGNIATLSNPISSLSLSVVTACGGRNRVLLGPGHRQLNVDFLHLAVKLFNKKIRGFANRERQVVWRSNFSSTAFEQEIARPYPGCERWSTLMYVLEHPALISVCADALQSRVNCVSGGNIPHPRMAKASVAGLEFCY